MKKVPETVNQDFFYFCLFACLLYFKLRIGDSPKL